MVEEDEKVRDSGAVFLMLCGRVQRLTLSVLDLEYLGYQVQVCMG